MSPHAIRTIAKIAEDLANLPPWYKAVDARRQGRRILAILMSEGLIPYPDPVDHGDVIGPRNSRGLEGGHKQGRDQ